MESSMQVASQQRKTNNLSTGVWTMPPSTHKRETNNLSMVSPTVEDNTNNGGNNKSLMSNWGLQQLDGIMLGGREQSANLCWTKWTKYPFAMRKWLWKQCKIACIYWKKRTHCKRFLLLIACSFRTKQKDKSFFVLPEIYTSNDCVKGTDRGRVKNAGSFRL